MIANFFTCITICLYFCCHVFLQSRFTGTIISIEDVDRSTWPGSEWRCFKVRKIVFFTVTLEGILMPVRLRSASGTPCLSKDCCLLRVGSSFK